MKLVMMTLMVMMLSGAAYAGQKGLHQIAPREMAAVTAQSGPIVLPPLAGVRRPAR